MSCCNTSQMTNEFVPVYILEKFFLFFYSCIPYGMYGLKCNQAADATGLLRLMRRMDGNCRKKVKKTDSKKELQIFAALLRVRG